MSGRMRGTRRSDYYEKQSKEEYGEGQFYIKVEVIIANTPDYSDRYLVVNLLEGDYIKLKAERGSGIDAAAFRSKEPVEPGTNDYYVLHTQYDREKNEITGPNLFIANFS